MEHLKKLIPALGEVADRISLGQANRDDAWVVLAAWQELRAVLTRAQPVAVAPPTEQPVEVAPTEPPKLAVVQDSLA